MSDYTIQAEDMDLDDYYVVSGSHASGGELIKISGNDGSASTTFGGEPAVYDMTVRVQDESDGQSTIEVVIDGVVVGTIVLNGDNNGGGSDNSGFTNITLEGIAIPAGAEIELRAFRDGGEYVRIDKIDLDKTGELETEAGQTVTLLCETFSGGNWGNVVSSDFRDTGSAAMTNGAYDGDLVFREVDLSGKVNGKIAFEAGTFGCGEFEDSGQYADYFSIILIDQNGNEIVLDTFTGDGRTLTGSNTGQQISPYLDPLEYDIPAGVTSAQLVMRSHISACDEKIKIDDVKITAEIPPEPVDPVDPVEPPAINAEDDAITVGEVEDITTDGGTTLNVLTNDGPDAGESVAGVSFGGVEMEVGQSFTVTTEGGRTGTVTLNADGSLEWDGGENFVDMMDGDTDSFQIEYKVQTSAEDMPKYNLLFVLDISNSTVNGNSTEQDIFVGENVADMNGDGLSNTVLDAEISAVKAAIQDLLDRAANGEIDLTKIDIGIVTFSGMAQGYTNVNAATLGTFAADDAALTAALESIIRGGWTNYEAGLQEAEDWFASQQGDGAINQLYFLSDGRPAIGSQNGQYIYQDESDFGDEVATLANTYDVDIHAIGIGANSDLDYLDMIDNTGGSVQVLNTSSLEAALVEGVSTVTAEATATVTVTINGEGQPILNEPPVAEDNTYALVEGESIGAGGTFVANVITDENDATRGSASNDGAGLVDNDPDGDPISMQGVTVDGVTYGPGESFRLVLTGTRDGQPIQVEGTGAIDENGNLTFTPDFGDGSVSVELFDGDLVSGSFDYTIKTVRTVTTTEEVVTTVTSTVSGEDQAVDIGFDESGLSKGDIVSNQISGLTVSSIRSDGSINTGHPPMIFDSENPTGGDWDLNTGASGNGAFLGNVLIISEDGDQNDPDDNASGGTLKFDFDVPTTVTELTILDVERGATLRFYDAGGNLITTQSVPSTSDGGYTTVAVNVDNVSSFTWTLPDSGAIAGMAFYPTTVTVTEEVVETVTTTEEIVETDTATVIITMDGEGSMDLFPAALDDSQTVTEGTPISLNILDNDTAGDGATTITSVEGGTPQGDGSFTIQVPVPNGGTTTLTVNPDGTVSMDTSGFTDLYEGESQTVVFDYTIADEDGDEATATVTLTVNGEGVDLVPDAVDDAQTVDEGTPISLNILDNDTDGDGPSTITAVEGGTPQGDGSYTIEVDTPNGGTTTLTVNPDGTVTMDTSGFTDLNDGESAQVTFDYTIADQDGDEDTATVTLTVNGQGQPTVSVTVAGSIEAPDGYEESQAIVMMIEASELTKQQNSSLQPTGDLNGDAFASTLLDQALTGVWDLANELAAGGRGDQVIDVVVFAASTRTVSFTAQEIADGYTMTASGLAATGTFNGFDNIEVDLTSDNGDIDYNAAFTVANDLLDAHGADDNHAILLTAQNDSDGTGYATELAELQSKAQVEAIVMNPALGVMDSNFVLDMLALADFIIDMDAIDENLAEILDDGGLDPSDFLAGVASRISKYAVEDAIETPNAPPSEDAAVVTQVDISVGGQTVSDVDFIQVGQSFQVGGVTFDGVDPAAASDVDVTVTWTDGSGATQVTTFEDLTDAFAGNDTFDFDLQL